MKTRKTLRTGVVALITAALVGASVVPAAAAPRDNKDHLLSATATLSSQAKAPLTVSGGSYDSCKHWNADANYKNAYLNSINFARGLAGLANVTANSTLQTYVSQRAQSFLCSNPTNPNYAYRSIGYTLVPGDPGSVRTALNDSKSLRAAILSPNAAHAALGVHKRNGYSSASEESALAPASTSQKLTDFNQDVAWPAKNTFFPVEYNNGIWSYYGKTTGAYSERLNFQNATVTVKQGTKTIPATKVTDDYNWNTLYEQLHFKVPGATAPTAKGQFNEYSVTISGVKKGSAAAPNISYTVKLVRTGATFAWKNQAPKITSQPAKNKSVKVDEWINLSAGVYVPNQQDVKYQWQYQKPKTKNWINVGYVTEPKIKVSPSGLSLNGSLIRLRVESGGKTVYTNNIKVKVTKYASKVSITKTSLKRNKKPVVTVKANRAGKATVTVSKGKTKITKTVTVKKNKATKVTLSKKIAKSSKSKGKWKVTVKFTPSNKNLYAGKSASKTIKVK
ncbi:hypothetical protein ACFSYH_05775 [Populibacterium corticicola]|uniref:Uncharacterized protein n=1 Tax=Populibacterium corticicola TaxID=1812826 RepID=A0ABW5XCN0_9MICO